MKNKKQEYAAFALEVIDHIENYVIPQYGDYPDAMIDGFTVQDIKAQLTRYVGRIGFNARGQQEAERDCLKIAHYACLLLRKLREEKKEVTPCEANVSNTPFVC